MDNWINSGKTIFTGTLSSADWNYHGHDNKGISYIYKSGQPQPVIYDDPVPVPIGLEYIGFYLSGIPHLDFDEIKLIVDAFDTDEERFAAIELVKELKRKLESV